MLPKLWLKLPVWLGSLEPFCQHVGWAGRCHQCFPHQQRDLCGLTLSPLNRMTQHRIGLLLSEFCTPIAFSSARRVFVSSNIIIVFSVISTPSTSSLGWSDWYRFGWLPFAYVATMHQCGWPLAYWWVCSWYFDKVFSGLTAFFIYRQLPKWW